MPDCYLEMLSTERGDIALILGIGLFLAIPIHMCKMYIGFTPDEVDVDIRHVFHQVPRSTPLAKQFTVSFRNYSMTHSLSKG